MAITETGRAKSLAMQIQGRHTKSLVGLVQVPVEAKDIDNLERMTDAGRMKEGERTSGLVACKGSSVCFRTS